MYPARPEWRRAAHCAPAWLCPKHGPLVDAVLCPGCIGEGCEQCDGNGWVLACLACSERWTYDLPAE